jgi:hypothetical protein
VGALPVAHSELHKLMADQIRSILRGVCTISGQSSVALISPARQHRLKLRRTLAVSSHRKGSTISRLLTSTTRAVATSGSGSQPSGFVERDQSIELYDSDLIALAGRVSPVRVSVS